jgi:hemolysin activation/secretion protein
MFIKLAFC